MHITKSINTETLDFARPFNETNVPTSFLIKRVDADNASSAHIFDLLAFLIVVLFPICFFYHIDKCLLHLYIFLLLQVKLIQKRETDPQWRHSNRADDIAFLTPFYYLF